MQQRLPKRLLGQLPAKLLASSTVVILAICALVYVQSLGLDSTPTTNSGGGIALQPPAFLQSVYAQENLAVFEDAGIIAYVNTEQTIDIGRIEQLEILKSVIDQTDEYIVGAMSPPGYAGIAGFQEDSDIQIFIHQNGWILAYLTRWQDASLLIDWINYGNNGLDKTTLENSIRHVMTRVGASDNNKISYYHFQYPDATDLMLIADKETLDDTTDSFDIKIPIAGFTLYESSWSHAGFHIRGPVCRLNNEVLNTLGTCRNCWLFKHGLIDTFKLQTGNIQQISVDHKRYNYDFENSSACGLALIYKRG